VGNPELLVQVKLWLYWYYTTTDSWKAFKILGAPANNKTEKEILVIDYTERVVWDCLNNKFDDSQQGADGEDDNEQGPIFNDLSPMTDPKRGTPNQEDDESSRPTKKPRAIDMNEQGEGEASNDAEPGSVKTSFSPLTVDSVCHFLDPTVERKKSRSAGPMSPVRRPLLLRAERAPMRGATPRRGEPQQSRQLLGPRCLMSRP
jgi:hypothetical protein